ncbi:homoserine dehydrogenase [Helicobacter vulpis]|uniref:homoserine dehydrogenase n=1 Tax=Helicobacter vulpis TaxID=2316076 RepID=UPI000EAFEEA8|nr:homoserine dehydrogenase [Helicobacter vulpis]
MRTLNIGIIGLGCVGMGVVEILARNQYWIAQRCGCRLQIRRGVVRDLSKKRVLDFPISDRVQDVLEDDAIDIVVELMGGVQEAFHVAKQALNRHKIFVSANKAMLAQHYHSLSQMAKQSLGFEASVGGGIPIISALQGGLGANQISHLAGILNGTSNFILEQMQQGADFKQALQQAQALGYAEADPSLDISGEDSAHKLLILATLAFHTRPTLHYLEGIEKIENVDIQQAQHLGYAIKLLARAQCQNGHLILSVRPTLIPQEHFLAQVHGVMNGVLVVGDCVGETFFYGAGAGGLASASAVVSDLMAVAKNPKAAPLVELRSYTYAPLPQSYYLRVSTSSLASVQSILENHGIALVSHHIESNTMACITEPVLDSHLQKALASLHHQSVRVFCVYESCPGPAC